MTLLFITAFGLSCLVLLALVLLGICKHLRLRDDFFFIVFVVQTVVYLYIGPSLDLYLSPRPHGGYYPMFMIGAFALFQVPLITAYVWLKNGASGECAAAFQRKRLGRSRLLIASLYSVAVCAGFVYVCSKDGLLYLWLGNEENTRVIRSLPSVDWWLFRGYLQGGLLLCLSWAILGAEYGQHKLWILMAGVCLAPWLVWSMLNTRSNVIVGALFICGFLVRGGVSIKLLARLIIIGCFAVYGLLVVVNARRQWNPDEGITLRVFVPDLSASDSTGHYSIYKRLNAIDAMAMMEDEIRTQGLAWGSAWAEPIKLFLLQPFYRVLGIDYASHDTGSPKVILLQRYANLSVVDYEACILTDIYGNVGFLGFPVAAILYAALYAWAQRLFRSGRAFWICVAFVIFYSLFYFEFEFLTVAYGWIRNLVFVVPLWAILFLPLSTTRQVEKIPKRICQ